MPARVAARFEGNQILMAKLIDDLPRGEAALARCARLEHLAAGLRGQGVQRSGLPWLVGGRRRGVLRGIVDRWNDTDDIDRDYQELKNNNIKIVREPTVEEWGMVLVFADLYGNLWDLFQPNE